MRWSFAPTLYLTDNEAVAKGFEKLKNGVAKPWQDHNDLWEQVRMASAAKDWQTQVKWIKGHANELNVATGLISEKEWAYIKGADASAVKGALAFKIPPSMKLELKKRQRVTEAWQRALVNIHEKRIDMLGLDQEQEGDEEQRDEDPMGWGGGLDSEGEEEHHPPTRPTRKLI